MAAGCSVALRFLHAVVDGGDGVVAFGGDLVPSTYPGCADVAVV